MRIDFLQLESVKSDNKVLNDYTFFEQPTGMKIACSPYVSKNENGCGDHGGSSKLLIMGDGVFFRTSPYVYFIPRSKTDVCREGNQIIIIRTGNVICPVNIVLRYVCCKDGH